MKDRQIWSFRNDYSEGCHPSILEALVRSNSGQQESYGDDDYSRDARAHIRRFLGKTDAEIHFVSGGTQANLIVIASALRPHESVITASTGHIHVHEAGAIEATGHKINAVENDEGKVTVEDIQAVLDEHTIIPHMVKPGMVYISNSTETGTIYSRKEIQALSDFCRCHGIYLFCDGARLGSALCARNNDLTLEDMAELTDVFYIGGTKNGALMGEAIVITNDRLKECFGFHLKQRGALLSKGRLAGVQFMELFRDDLFFSLARHANAMAMKMAVGIQSAGYDFLSEPVSNQIFPIFPNTLIDQISKNFGFYTWKKVDCDTSAIRLVTSWATPENIVEQFIRDLAAFL